MKLFQIPSRTAQAPLESAEDFARFYEQAHLSVFRYVMVLCAGNQDEAEDITSEAFFRAWEKRRLFSGSPSAALGWVITIARNSLIDHRRAAGRYTEEDILDEAVTDQSTSVEETLVDGEQLAAVLRVLHSLPFPQGDMVALRYVLGWRVKTIAEHFGLAENTVSVALKRAIVTLQRRLALIQEPGVLDLNGQRKENSTK